MLADIAPQQQHPGDIPARGVLTAQQLGRAIAAAVVDETTS